MSEGWISIHRKIQDSSVWTNPEMLKLWLLCLMKASHKEQPHYIFDGKVVPLVAGEFITGRKVLAEEYNRGMTLKARVSESTIERWLKKFEKMQMLNIKKTTKYSVVTVINWHEYQRSEHQMNITCTSDEHHLNTINNDNKQQDQEEYKYINARASQFDFEQVAQEYKKTFPRKPLTDYIAQSMAEWINVFGGDSEIIRYALKNAAEYSADNFKYVERILERWQVAGVKTVGDAKGLILEFEESKREPDAFLGRKETVGSIPTLPVIPMIDWTKKG